MDGRERESFRLRTPELLLLNKVAIVTGGGRGVGRAIAYGLAREGTTVVSVARTRSQIEETAEIIHSGGGRALPIVADVTDETAVGNMVREAHTAFGRIDILVYSAGTLPPFKPVEEVTLTEFQKGFSVDVDGMFLCAKAVVPIMKAQQSGRIIIISAASAKRPLENGTAFSAAKNAQIAFARSLAAEVGRHGITVNTVDPLLPNTQMAQDFFTQVGLQTGLSKEELLENIVNQTLIERAPSDEELGDYVAFLCSDRASLITAQSLNLEGGWITY